MADRLTIARPLNASERAVLSTAWRRLTTSPLPEFAFAPPLLRRATDPSPITDGARPMLCLPLPRIGVWTDLQFGRAPRLRLPPIVTPPHPSVGRRMPRRDAADIGWPDEGLRLIRRVAIPMLALVAGMAIAHVWIAAERVEAAEQVGAWSGR